MGGSSKDAGGSAHIQPLPKNTGDSGRLHPLSKNTRGSAHPWNR